MCGIIGIIDPAQLDSGEPPERALIERMTAAVAARGPDGAGIWTAPGVGLGHRRLKVIDLSDAAAQPMGGPDGAVQVVFNGEIYNFADLRAELVAHGHRFRSRTDTEVLVHGYERWGDGLLPRLQGMFAFAIWDGRRRRLLAARDRMGKKPLYFTQVARGTDPPLFAFASELKGLLPVPGFSRALEPVALARYLAFEYVPPPHAIFAGTRKLDAGEQLVLELADDRRARPEVRRYWQLRFPDWHEPWSTAEAAAELRVLLRRAVERRLVADVPLGAFLSGGLDSSTVVANMAEIAGADRIATFSIGFADPSHDESAHARAVAQHLHTDHHEQRLDGSALLAALPEVAAFLDEPLADASIVPTFLLSRFTRGQVTVALSGDGGDELFAGYPTFTADRAADAFQRLPPVAQRLIARAANRLPARSGYFSLDFKVHQFLRGGAEVGPRRHQRWLAAFLPEEIPSLLSPDLAAALPPGDDPLADLDSDAGHPADRLMAFYARHYLANDVNVKVDRASSAVGLEVRCPLQDAELVAFASQLPPTLRRRGLEGKYILKQSMRGRLPRAILARRKQGFAIPVARWLREELRPALLDQLHPTLLRRQSLFNPTAVARVLDDHLSGRRDRRKQLWTLFTFQRWLERWG
jgi:asparagine synthase (glutamine-hydrolysing)